MFFLHGFLVYGFKLMGYDRVFSTHLFSLITGKIIILTVFYFVSSIICKNDNSTQYGVGSSNFR